MPPLLRHIGLGAQRQPDVTRWNARVQSLVRSASGELGQNEITDERRPSTTEFRVDCAEKLTATHQRTKRIRRSVKRKLWLDGSHEVIGNDIGEDPVSYTHLTLPTIYSV